jgi:O-antigen/teichoic acid export membrane protein
MHILSQSDRIFITKIWGKSDTAFYSLAYTYGILLYVFTNAVSDGWLPWFHDTYYAGEYDKIRKNVKPLVVLGCYIGLACIALYLLRDGN